MTLLEFFQVIKPGLTFYGVIVTLSILFFRLWRFFWKLEKDIHDENIGRLKELIDGFREAHIEPVLEEKLIEARRDAFELALGSLSSDLKATGNDRQKKIDAVSEASLKGRVESLISQDHVVPKFVESASGLNSTGCRSSLSVFCHFQLINPNHKICLLLPQA